MVDAPGLLGDPPASLDALAAFLLEIDAQQHADRPDVLDGLDGAALPGADWHIGLPNGPDSLIGEESNALLLHAEEEHHDATPSPRQTALLSRQRAYRKKKKAAQRELRAQAASLAAQLVALQSRQAQATGTVSGWRGVALRQLRRRQDAEALNRVLRAQISQRHGLALQLIETLRARVSSLPSSRSLELLSTQPRKPVMVLNDTDRSLIDTFLGQLAGMLTCADELLDASAIPELEPGVDHSYRHGHRRDRHTGADYAEFAEAQAIPFGLMDAMYAMHKAIPVLTGRECEPVVVALPGSPFAMATKSQFSYSANASVKYESIFVSEAVEKEGHWLLVWRGLTREISSSNSVGALFLDEGWGTAREFPRGSDGDSPGTVFEFYTRMRSHHSSPLVSSSARLVEYLQEIVSSAASEAMAFSRVMENALVDGLAELSISRRVGTGFPAVNVSGAAS